MTIFAEMSALAARIGAVNLGQGFPDEDGPPAMLKVAENAIADGVNQYPPGLGIAPLREAIADQRRRNFGTEYDPDTEVLVTVGATEAIAASVLGLVEPGSEVLLIEPFYDSYSPVIAMAGCHRRAVPLRADGRGFAIDVDGLRRAVTPKTKALIVNSPHNPTGMVATDDELRRSPSSRVDADLLVITDEVYEHLVFDGRQHLCRWPTIRAWPTAPSPSPARPRCSTSPAGRSDGPAAQRTHQGVRAAKQYLSYVGGAPFQPAVAQALATEDAWVAALRDSLQAKRDRLGSALADMGFDVHDSFGTYFLCADPRPLGYRRQHRVLRRAAENASAWPPSRCRRSATRQPSTPTNGITWCASPSASATTRSTRRSAGWKCYESSVLQTPTRTFPAELGSQG